MLTSDTTLEAETRYVLNPNTLRADDWTAGDRLWFIDWIAPFGARDTRKLRGEMAKKFPGQLARALRVKLGKPDGRVATFAGNALSREQSQSIRAKYFAELTESLESHPEREAGFKLRQPVQTE